ncbi:phosphoribosylformylglycinamidine synthase [Coemansia sp. Cherry 401B]|nr:phosphoribosylformylglycinamidine synthase [Coemansia sp. Cherry 401B]
MLLRTPGESGAPQVVIQRVLGDQDPDFEKLKLADKAADDFGLCGLGDIVQRVERGVVYCITFADNQVIPLFRLSEHMQIINAESDRIIETLYESSPAVVLIFAHSEPRPLREVPIRGSADSDELARLIRNIEEMQAQVIAEQTEGTAASVLAQANRKLGLALATDEIVYRVNGTAGTLSALEDAKQRFVEQKLAAVKYVDRRDYTVKDERIPYPMNLNGPELNVAAVVTPNSHVLAIMPRPERVVRKEASSYMPPDDLASWEHGPSIRLFNNTRCWVYRQPNI